MNFKILFLQKNLYEYELEAENHKDAEWVAQQFFSLKSERPEHQVAEEVECWTVLAKSLKKKSKI